MSLDGVSKLLDIIKTEQNSNIWFQHKMQVINPAA